MQGDAPSNSKETHLATILNIISVHQERLQTAINQLGSCADRTFGERGDPPSIEKDRPCRPGSVGSILDGLDYTNDLLDKLSGELARFAPLA